MRTKDDVRSAAVLTLRSPHLYSKKGAKEIAAWLRKQAKYIEGEERKALGPRYTARYLYVA